MNMYTAADAGRAVGTAEARAAELRRQYMAMHTSRAELAIFWNGYEGPDKAEMETLFVASLERKDERIARLAADLKDAEQAVAAAHKMRRAASNRAPSGPAGMVAL